MVLDLDFTDNINVMSDIQDVYVYDAKNHSVNADATESRPTYV